jgi:arylsulfatase A-like enzyme
VIQTSSRYLLSVALLVASTLILTGATLEDAKAAAPPNILIIVTDDQRDGLHVMDDTMRWFGQGGTQYTNAMSPLLGAVRRALRSLTGRYVHNHRVVTDGRAESLNQTTTINHYLDNAGYHTALFGKYLNRRSDLVHRGPRRDVDKARLPAAGHSSISGRTSIEKPRHRIHDGCR